MELECETCHEEWYADGEEGQENCPACGVKSSTPACTGCKEAGSPADEEVLRG